MESSTDAGTQEELGNVAHRPGELLRDTNKVVLANRNDFDGVGEFVGFGRGVDILGDQL